MRNLNGRFESSAQLWIVICLGVALALFAFWGGVHGQVADNSGRAPSAVVAALPATVTPAAHGLVGPRGPQAAPDTNLDGPHAFVVTGRVVGRPLGSAWQVKLRRSNGEVLDTIGTDANGRYRFVHVAVGRYVLQVEDENERSIPLQDGGELFLSSDDDEPMVSHDIQLGGAYGNTPVAAPLRVQGTGQITGVVTAADTGLPIQNVYINVSPSGGFASTDAAGRYSVGGLATGIYTVYFSPYDSLHMSQWYNGQSSQASATPVTVTDGITTAEINAALILGGRITGRVTDATSGLPVAGIDVYAPFLEGIYISSPNETLTDPSGYYTITQMPTSQHRIVFSGKGYVNQYYNNKPGIAGSDIVSVTIGNLVSGIDAVMVRGGQIRGQVIAADSSLPLQGISVNLYDNNGVGIRWTTTKASGSYTLTGIASGSYRLLFSDYANGYLSQYYNTEPSLVAADPLIVTAPNVVSGINVVLVRGGQITGTIIVSDTGLPPANAGITAINCNGDFYYGNMDASGTYSVTGLPSGAYRVLSSNFAGPYLDTYYGGQTTLAAAAWITVSAPSSVGNINFALQTGGVITGRVTMSDTGFALSYPNVRAYDTTGRRAGHSSSDASGNYTINALASGAYRVWFRPNSGMTDPYIPEYYNRQPSLTAATAVVVSAPLTVTGINAALQHGAPIIGQISHSDGGYETYPTILVYDSNSTLIQTRSSSPATGVYTTYAVPPGNYRILAQPQGYPPYRASYVQTYYGQQYSLATANQIPVVGNSPVAGIDISLDPGGIIAGYLTNQGTGAPLSWVIINVYDLAGNVVATAYEDTSSSPPGGPYLTSGLKSGNYKVAFSDYLPTYPNYRCNPVPFMTQFYNGKSSSGQADIVSVTSPNTTGNIDAALVQPDFSALINKLYLPLLSR